MLACADIEEGIVLRRGGVHVPILVFGALSVSDLDGVFSHDLTPTISTPSAARALQDAAARHGVVLHCHLKIDTGMNRLGFRHDNLEASIPEVASSSHLAIDAVYTHFATADDPEHPLFAEQRERFESALRAPARTRRHRLGPPRRELGGAASRRARLVRLRPSRAPAVRHRSAAACRHDCAPACALAHSRIVAVKGLRPGEGTGYGMKTLVDRPTTVAVVPAGYADGLDLRLAGRGHMLVRGRRAPIVGSVCMDMTMIDVTGTDAAPGDEVVILGQQDDEMMDVREMAAAVGTIPYELLCRLGARIQRVYEYESGLVPGFGTRDSRIRVRLGDSASKVPVRTGSDLRRRASASAGSLGTGLESPTLRNRELRT